MAPSPKATETVSSQSESKEENDSTQQASDILSEANCHPTSKYPLKGLDCEVVAGEVVEGETGSSSDAIPKVSLARLSLILSTLWVCKPSTRKEISWKLLMWVIPS
jgi:hypothetical protein